jgi:hypothetical protein
MRSKIKQPLPGSREVPLQDLTVWEGIPPFNLSRTVTKDTTREAFDDGVADLMPCIFYAYNMHRRSHLT